MPQVLNSDAELAGKRLLTTDATLTNTFAGVSTLTGSLRISGQPVCLLRNVGTQSIPNNTVTACTFNTEGTDVGAMHSAVSPSRITIPTGQGGTYLVVGAAAFAANTTGTRALRIVVNGASSGMQASDTASTQFESYRRIQDILPLSAGDFLELMVFQTSGGALNIGHATELLLQTLFRAVKLS